MTALPGSLADNPRLDQWVSFPAPGKVGIATGKVEIGQGVLTAMLQIAADELDVVPARITLRSGETNATPNEGFTSGSRSIQTGGVALRYACAEVRALFLGEAARLLGCDVGMLAVRDGAILRDGAPTDHDYWTLARTVSLARNATASITPKQASERTLIGQNAARLDLPAKVFGQAVFIHDMMLDGMRHARAVRQPCRGATLETVDEAAIRRAAKGAIDIIRHGNFLAIVGDDETAVEAAAVAAPTHVTWAGVEPRNPQAQEAGWLLQQPSVDRTVGAPEPETPVRGQSRYEQSYSRAHLAHASIAPSCAIAQYKDGHLTVWTHAQGVYQLRAALAKQVGLDPATISVRHVQGAGCYGHFEPVSPAMVVKVGALLNETGRPADWTAEIWSGCHVSRPGSGNLLAAEALPNPPPKPIPTDPPDAGGGGATRNGSPLYDIAAKRIIHHLVPETAVRTSSLRGLGAMPNIFAIESFIDELAERASKDPVAYRLTMQSDPRAHAVIVRAAEMAAWDAGAARGTGRGRGIGFARYKNTAAYAAVVVELEIDEEIRLLNMWCAADAGLVINPDGVINQLEGGMIQSASWVLKEQVRIDTDGISSLDWESYPVLRFSEVPETKVELIASDSDMPLGVGEATAGPTAAAIGNAVSHALGARIRDLPLTRERIMATLLAQ